MTNTPHPEEIARRLPILLPIASNLRLARRAFEDDAAFEAWRDEMFTVIAESIRAECQSSEAPGWRPMESVPKDGCFLIANSRGQVCPVKSNDGFRIVSNMPGYADWDAGTFAVAWMPLPVPPVSEGAK